MKVKADRAKCCGHARCAAVAEAFFILDDDGYIAIDEVSVTADVESLVRRGVRSCPERALTLIEETSAESQAS